MRLDLFENPEFSRGASRWQEALWLAVGSLLFSSWLPGSGWRVLLLRWFGARVGCGVVIKPNVRVKFPWRLAVGDYCWIGESVWIDNLAQVSLGNHSCLSQGAYLCTGSHDWTQETFDLVVKPITVRNHAWVGAMARVAPGVVIGEGAVLSLASVALHDLDDWMICSGHPAVAIKKRVIKHDD
jgi:putative colanic acid biosynthesis acetyltransferase WcaF